jgi:hypothetical protein
MFCSLMPVAACLFLCQVPVVEEVVSAIPEHQETALTIQPIVQAESIIFSDGLDEGSIRHDEIAEGFFDEPCVIDGEEWDDQNPGLDRRLKPGSMTLASASPSGSERITGGNRWTKVPYQPLQFSLALPEGTNPDAVRFWLNGLPADPEMLSLQSDWSSVDPRNVSATYQWDCPPLGKIVLQMKYLRGDVWSQLSSPLRFEVMPPSVPQPIAAGATVSGLIPLAIPTPSIECLNNIVVKFANLAPGASVVADVEGYGPILGGDQSNCCYSFDLKSLLPVGRHKMTFRHVDSKHCGLSSHASSPIAIDLSFDPNVEVAIDNIKSARRVAMLTYSEHLIRETHGQEVEWMRQIMRDPCPKLWPSAGQTEGASNTIETKVGTSKKNDPCASESTNPPPAKPSDTTPTVTLLNRTSSAEKLVSSSSAEEIPPIAKPTHLDGDCKRPDLFYTLSGQANLWDKRSLQASALSSYLESLESSQDSIMTRFKTSKTVSKIDFDTPTVFKSSRKVYSTVGAVAGDLTILEGMRISASANGSYRIEFKYIAPQTPAIVHLQIQFLSDESSGWKTLTLAPITVKPIDYDEPETVVHQVIREGYSAALERVGGHVIQVRRRGSAVSGYNLSGATESIQF